MGLVEGTQRVRQWLYVLLTCRGETFEASEAPRPRPRVRGPASEAPRSRPKRRREHQADEKPPPVKRERKRTLVESQASDDTSSWTVHLCR